MKLDGRVALVTGASRGIGRGIASRMAREGAAVVANYYRSESAGHELVEEIRSSGGKAIAVKADVGDYDQVKAMVERGVGEFGKLDIVVSNAGIFGPRKRLADITPEEFLEIINNHLIAAYNCAHTAFTLPAPMRTWRYTVHIVEDIRSLSAQSLSLRHCQGGDECPGQRGALPWHSSQRDSPGLGGDGY